MAENMGAILGQIVGPLAGQSTDINATPDNVRKLFRLRATFSKDAADAMAADASDRTFWRAPFPCKVVSAHYLPDAALTADNTNYATLTLQAGTAGALVSAASRTTQITGSGNFVADTPVSLTLSATSANRKLDAGEILNFAIAKSGSGVAVPAGTLHVELEPVDE